jgi:hypothetical protein
MRAQARTPTEELWLRTKTRNAKLVRLGIASSGTTRARKFTPTS